MSIWLLSVVKSNRLINKKLHEVFIAVGSLKAFDHSVVCHCKVHGRIIAVTSFLSFYFVARVCK